LPLPYPQNCIIQPLGERRNQYCGYLEESLSTTVQSEHYFEESLGVYSSLLLPGNLHNPMTVPGRPPRQ
jgi:hypothetical protein